MATATADAAIDIQTEDEQWSGNDESEPDLEADALADAFLRDINSQIWAELDRTGLNPSSTTEPATPTDETMKESESSDDTDEDDDPMIATITIILSHAASNPSVRAALDTTIVPTSGGATLFTVLSKAVAAGGVAPELAGPLSVLVAALAKGEAVPQQSIATSKGKRKREVDDVGTPPPKPTRDLPSQILDAVALITRALQGGPINPATVASLQTQLQQVFLFAATSTSIPGSNANALQEITNLIQILGMLSRIPIAPLPDDVNPSWQPFSIGTAVYPCLFQNCGKIFSRPSHLRSHARSHANHRPFKCGHCPASFARNHDLARHLKGHSNKAFRCLGCGKTFTRRDAVKRHKENPKSFPACKVAQVESVFVEENDIPRRGERLWNNAVRQAASTSSTQQVQQDVTMENAHEDPEDGELNAEMVKSSQSAVQSLHALLHSHVAQWQAAVAGSHPMLHTPANGHAHRNQHPNGIPVVRLPPQYDPALFADSPSTSLQPPKSKASSSDSNPTADGTGLDRHQANLLEQAIAFVAAQAEEEALLEQEDDSGGESDS